MRFLVLNTVRIPQDYEGKLTPGAVYIEGHEVDGLRPREAVELIAYAPDAFEAQDAAAQAVIDQYNEAMSEED